MNTTDLTIVSDKTPTIIQSPDGWVFFLSSDFLQVTKSNIGYAHQHCDRSNLIWLALDGVSQPYEDTSNLLMNDEDVYKLPLARQPFYYGFQILRLDTFKRALQDAFYHPYKIRDRLFGLEKKITHFPLSQLNYLLDVPQGKEPCWWLVWLQKIQDDPEFVDGSISLSTAEYLLSPPWYDSSICNYNPEV